MAVRQLDLAAVVDELAALNGAAVTVEVHAPGRGAAPRAILSGTVGALSMDDESEGGEARGLLFVPIGSEARAEPGLRPGIYFHQEYFAWAEGAAGLTIGLEDRSFFLLRTES